MQFRCEDLPDAGVRLIPHDSPNFGRLLSEITRHIESPPPGGPLPLPNDKTVLPDPDEPASAILWNGSGKPICAYTIMWKPGGTHIITPGLPSPLLPFGLPAERRAFHTYWHTIMPNSKRWLASGKMLGSNADLRAPEGDEIWKGGVIRWNAGGPRRSLRSDTVTLTIDAVFFSTGECAGPDTRRLWEHVVFPAKMHQQIAAAARKGVREGFEIPRILADVEQITGPVVTGPPPPPPPPGRAADPAVLHEHARWHVARHIAQMRQHAGDDKTVSTLNDWADAKVPEFRRI